MDAFSLTQEVIKDYTRYVGGFLNIRDERIRDYVDRFMKRGTLWPEAYIQLNPAYENGASITELVDEGLLHPDCAKIFIDKEKKPFRLYKHQEEAVRLGVRGESFILTSGTGSGKSLCYFIPSVDYVLKNETEGVAAIIVYPMNALINSQLEAIRNLIGNYPDCGIKVARYTGQESDREKESIREDPPHILLTNYVMLELMLSRRHEHVLIRGAKFIVFDEIHTYTGRRGADIALLIRKLSVRTERDDLVYVGTSATLATEGSPEERKKVVSQVASSFFGKDFPPENVIDEKLRKIATFEGELTKEMLAEALREKPSEDISSEDFLKHPITAWIEKTFGIEERDGHLFRRKPITLTEGAKKLKNDSGLEDLDYIKDYLRYMFYLGSRLKDPHGETTIFPFKLHQFLSQGEYVYATLERPSKRFITAQGTSYTSDGRPLYPLVFCRECGQEFYPVMVKDDKFIPFVEGELPGDEENGSGLGYIFVEENPGDVWSEERIESLPDSWKTRGGRVGKKYKPYVPVRYWVKPDGEFSLSPSDKATPVWFFSRPFMFCPYCEIAYTKKEKEFRKLSSLSSGGRSTSTTVISISAVSSLKKQGLPKRVCKLLSFTDNRQDASLQAGHFNDFVQVAFVRAGIYKALEKHKRLRHDEIALRVCDELGLSQEDYAKEPGPENSRTYTRSREALTKYLEYRIFEDLRYGWRVVQPNLEQVGLLRIEYDGLEEICSDLKYWEGIELLAKASPEARYTLTKCFLDYLRTSLAIDAEVLNPEKHYGLKKIVSSQLKEPWVFDEGENLRQFKKFVIPPERASEEEMSLGARTRIGLFIRDLSKWSGDQRAGRMTEKEYLEFLPRFLEVLREGGFLHIRDGRAVLLRDSAIVWALGDGAPPPPDPVRSRQLKTADFERIERKAHEFFQELYKGLASSFGILKAREHTGQIFKEDRETREREFREGDLQVLYCSPTMELGIDIADLNAVHMRNVPPSPANYAQRSGRAGRSGQPAVVVTYCSAMSPHDQYFFYNPVKVIAGEVVPPKFDLENEDLLKEHLHSIWLSKTGLYFRGSINEMLNLETEGYPLREEIRKSINSEYAFEKALEEALRIPIFRDKETEWIESVLKVAPEEFDRAFSWWRVLFRLAEKQKEEAERLDKDLRLSRVSRKDYKNKVLEAERKWREARRQQDLLLNKSLDNESDFYPYRYLACEGFLPGYNFPRLPVRAYLAYQDRGEYVSRPRFLAIREFAPFNLIYHNGQIFMVNRVMLPAGRIEDRLHSVSLCKMCGYIHGGDAEVCVNCGVHLNASTALVTDELLNCQMWWLTEGAG